MLSLKPSLTSGLILSPRHTANCGKEIYTGDSRNILLIQYLFVFLLSGPEPTTFPRLPGEVQKKKHTGQTRHGRTMGGGNGSFTWRRGWERPPSGKRAPWPLRGQSPEWRRRRAAASEKGSWHNQWWDSQTRSQFQLQSQPPLLWQPQLQWTWLLCQCPLKWHSFGNCG